MRSEFRDLHKLAQQRTRDAAGLVIQLLDSEEECTALLLACAIDFVDGAAQSIRESAAADGKITEEQARASALAMLITSFGKRTVVAAFQQLKEQSQ